MEWINKDFNFDIDVKSAKEDKNIGTFSGYANVYNYKDFSNEIMLSNCFADYISANKSERIPMFYNHAKFGDKPPIGGFNIADMKEDAIGLAVKGEINLNTQTGKEVYSAIKAGDLKKLSIGFKRDEYTIDDNDRTIKTSKATLREISVVAFPANDKSTILSIKSLDDIKFSNDDITLEQMQESLALLKEKNDIPADIKSKLFILDLPMAIVKEEKFVFSIKAIREFALKLEELKEYKALSYDQKNEVKNTINWFYKNIRKELNDKSIFSPFEGKGDVIRTEYTCMKDLDTLLKSVGFGEMSIKAIYKKVEELKAKPAEKQDTPAIAEVIDTPPVADKEVVVQEEAKSIEVEPATEEKKENGVSSVDMFNFYLTLNRKKNDR
ncbi:MAG: HK97 family phage prohead protease [Acholeplasmatales bacterium]|jgi:HK97 family phage prohead protease|nr:HK97 family phage prohead protease [Acholeplasmatales bacterium]